MTFTEHLRELRDRIIYSGIAVIVAFVLCYMASNYLFFIIAKPLDPLSQSSLVKWIVEVSGTAPEAAVAEEAAEHASRATAQWVTLNPLEGFLVNFKLAAYFSLLLSLPFILYQICAFVFPGLKESERRMVQWLIAGCSVLGSIGVIVAYFFVFPLVLPYLLRWTPEGVTVQLRMSETINIILIGLVGFGIAFQFPMAVLVLVWLEVLTPESLKQHRKLAIIGLAVISAVFTPPDPISMIIMLVPLALLYELSILMAQLVAKRKTAPDTGAEPA
jgi:sec-independent protein translocase protein TatC